MNTSFTTQYQVMCTLTFETQEGYELAMSRIKNKGRLVFENGRGTMVGTLVSHDDEKRTVVLREAKDE